MQGAAKFKYTGAENGLKTAARMFLPTAIPLMIADNKRTKLYNDRSVIPFQPRRSLSKLPKKTIEASIEDDVRAINDITKRGGVNNCANCVLAYDMRRRGYDVSAAPTNEPTNVYKLIDKFYDGEKDALSIKFDPKEYEGKVSVSNKTLARDAYNKMTKQAEEKFESGARGFIEIGFMNSNIGHVFNWEVDDSGINFYDAQSGKKRDVMVNFSSAMPIYELTRLDNLTPNDNITVRLKNGRSK